MVMVSEKAVADEEAQDIVERAEYDYAALMSDDLTTSLPKNS